MSHDPSEWRELAEKVSTEQDPEKLMALVEELTGSCHSMRRLPGSLGTGHVPEEFNSLRVQESYDTIPVA